jgi:methylthioribulose-1-phosphate dehydratase
LIFISLVSFFAVTASLPSSYCSSKQTIRSDRRYHQVLKPSACTPLFLAAFTRGAGCCIHTHSQWAVLVTLLVERDFGSSACFEIEEIEQIKGIGKGRGKVGNLGYHDRLRIPIIENTAL